MISFQEALKQVDKKKIDLMRKNLPSGNRYASEQMTSKELHKYVINNGGADERMKHNSSEILPGKMKRNSNGHFLGRHIVPVKNAKVSVKKNH